MTITLKLELRIGLLGRQQIARSLIAVGNCQRVARLVDAGHLRVQKVNDVTRVPISDQAC